MSKYGFRLFTASLRKGEGRKAVPFKHTQPDSDLADFIAMVWESRRDVRVIGLPHEPAPEGEEADGPDRSRDPIFYIEEVARIGRHIGFKVRYGRPGDHDRATSPEGSSFDKDITGLPPTRGYYGFLIVPSGAGDCTGVLAVEAISGACPQAPLQRWLRQWASESPVALGPGTAPAWWKLVLKPLGDDELLNSYLRRAQPNELVLTRHKERIDRQMQKEELRLTAAVDTDAARRATRRELKAWQDAFMSERPIDRAVAASSVAAILGDEIAEVGFDDVSIRVEDDDFGPRTLTPNSMSDVFTYQVGDRAPDRDEFLGHVRRAVSRVLYEEKPDFDWTGWPSPRG
ncbi:hypothetical protein [Cellulomonas taurus]|uniref:hypothetical protein n=1 Tax=Cellulomonas taurus TaxID=2729175 RepID=UPI00145E340D|nr:hypothetical protein [Cellulomonas taurus]